MTAEMAFEMAYSQRMEPLTEDGRRDIDVHVLTCDKGRLEWECKSGVMFYLVVHREYRRQGVATALWGAAAAIAPISHSEYRTVDGDAWASAVGSALPTLVKA